MSPQNNKQVTYSKLGQDLATLILLPPAQPFLLNRWSEGNRLRANKVSVGLEQSALVGIQDSRLLAYCLSEIGACIPFTNVEQG